MDIGDKGIILERTKCIINSKLAGIYRKHGDIWFEFEKNEKTYVLLLQTFFRICNPEGVLVTDTDKYRANGEQEDDFEWDSEGANAFDQWLMQYSSELAGGVFVTETEMNIYGDFIIRFNNDSFLVVYIEVTNDTECWRFFQKDDAEENDLIVFGNFIIH